MLHVPRAKSMTNWASICGLRCNQKENRNTHHTVGPTGIDVEHHLQGNYDTRTTVEDIYSSKCSFMAVVPKLLPDLIGYNIKNLVKISEFLQQIHMIGNFWKLAQL